LTAGRLVPYAAFEQATKKVRLMKTELFRATGRFALL